MFRRASTAFLCIMSIWGATSASSLRLGLAADDAPWFCHGLNCPAFTQFASPEGVELRTYQGNLWVSTLIEGTSLDAATSTGFSRLFNYISGANAGGSKIEMTAPVAVKVFPGSGPNCVSTFKVSFFIPFAYQSPAAGPPAPTSADVFLETIPAMEVAVSEYSGFTNEAATVPKAAELAAQVQNSSSLALADDESWWFAGYDPPFRLTNRHNEVWISVKPK